MTTTLSNQQRFDAAFAQIAAVIRKENHNDASILRMVADMMASDVEFAHGFARHVADVLDEHTESVNYTDIVVEAFRRALFDETTTNKYQTNYFGGDPAKAESFVQTMCKADASGALSFDISKYMH